MLISLKFPEGVAFQPIMSNLEEEIIEETTPIRGNLWKTRKASIACQNPLGLSSRETGRYDLQIAAFQTLKNARSIAAIETLNYLNVQSIDAGLARHCRGTMRAVTG